MTMLETVYKKNINDSEDEGDGVLMKYRGKKWVKV